MKLHKWDIIDWLNRKFNIYRKANIISINRATGKTISNTESEVGRIALQSVQTLIKMKHIDKYNDKDAGCLRMDGNADNYMELDDVVLDKEDQYLVDAAQRLLRYGF